MTATTNHWLTIKTVGTRSNRDGIGAQVQILTADGKRQYALVSGAGSYLSSSDERVHFGLGGNKSVNELRITGPSGTSQKIEGVKADQVLVIREPLQ